MISFTSNWKKDEKKEYLISKTKIKNVNESEVSKKVSKKIVTVEVLDSNDDCYVIEWTEFEESKSFLKKIFYRIFKLRLGETFCTSYKTSKEGIIDEFIDTNDLNEQIRILREYLRPIGKTKNEKEFLENTINDDVIKARLLKVINIFHFPYCEEFSKSETIEEIEMSNIFMEGNEIPGELINSLIYYDKDSQIGEIQIEKKYDQIAFNKILKESITEIDIKLAKNRTKENMPLFVATEKFWYKVDFKSGWIINGKYEKVFYTKNGEKIEKIEINSIE